MLSCWSVDRLTKHGKFILRNQNSLKRIEKGSGLSSARVALSCGIPSSASVMYTNLKEEAQEKVEGAWTDVEAVEDGISEVYND